MRKTPPLTQERLREFLVYAPETGQCMRVDDGRKIGSLDTSTGYIRIWIDEVQYYVHRLAHFWVLGVWPEQVTDHKDTNKTNNRWENIRPANDSNNMANRSKQSNNKHGLKGVSLCKTTGRWRASITVRGKSMNLGRYDDMQEAHAAYAVAAVKHFGEFARVA